MYASWSSASRGQLAIEATRRNAEQVVRLGQGVRAARIRRHLTQQQLADRAGIARYPEVFAARFPGSSHGWPSALTVGTEPPAEPGLVWADVATSRVFAWRRR